MSYLTSLPLELFDYIIACHVTDTGIIDAWIRTRLVCRLFADRITKEVLGNQPLAAFEDWESVHLMWNRKNMCLYLELRMLQKDQPRCWLTEYLRKVLDDVIETSGCKLADDKKQEEYLRDISQVVAGTRRHKYFFPPHQHQRFYDRRRTTRPEPVSIDLQDGLAAAAAIGSKELIQCYLDKGATPTGRIVPRRLLQPLSAAAVRGRVEALNYLLDHVLYNYRETPQDQVQKCAEMALEVAIADEQQETSHILVEFLMKNFSEHDDRILVMTAKSKHHNVFLQALDYHRTWSTHTIARTYHAACESGSVFAVKYLLERELLPLHAISSYAPYSYDISPIMVVIKHRHSRLLQLLLEKGAVVVSPEDAFQYDPVEHALWKRDMHALNTLVRHGAVPTKALIASVEDRIKTQSKTRVGLSSACVHVDVYERWWDEVRKWRLCVSCVIRNDRRRCLGVGCSGLSEASEG